MFERGWRVGVDGDPRGQGLQIDVVLAVAADRLAHAGVGAVEFAEIFEQLGLLQVQHRVGGMGEDRRVQPARGGGLILGPHPDQLGQLAVGVGVVRPAPQRLVEGVFGLGKPALTLQRAREHKPRLGGVDAFFERSTDGRLALDEHLGADQGHAVVVLGDRAAGLDRDGALIGGDGVVVLAHRLQRHPIGVEDVNIGAGLGGRRRQHIDGLLRPAEQDQQFAQADDGGPEQGIERQGPAEGGFRLRIVA